MFSRFAKKISNSIKTEIELKNKIINLKIILTHNAHLLKQE